MSAQHTQGRLVARDEWLIPADQAERPVGGSSDKVKDRNYYANIVTTVNGKHHDNIANARRLVACWNACEGLETESLERIAPLSELLVGDYCRSEKALIAAERELTAARALLREAADTYDIAEGSRISKGPRELAKRIRVYLDACDTQGGGNG